VSLLRKKTFNLRHPMSLRHPVWTPADATSTCELLHLHVYVMGGSFTATHFNTLQHTADNQKTSLNDSTTSWWSRYISIRINQRADTIIINYFKCGDMLMWTYVRVCAWLIGTRWCSKGIHQWCSRYVIVRINQRADISYYGNQLF